MDTQRNPKTPSNERDETVEHTPNSDARRLPATRPMRTRTIELAGVNIPNLLTTVVLAGGIIWNAAVMTWHASELASNVKELQATVSVLRLEVEKLQVESHAQRSNLDVRLARIEERVDAYMRAVK